MVWRVTLFRIFLPVGVEADGLGMAVLFWDSSVLASEIPNWWFRITREISGNWPPGYPLAIASLKPLLDDPLMAGRYLSAFASGVLTFVVAYASKTVSGRRDSSLLAAGLMATAPLSVAWDVRVRPETLFQVFFFGSIASTYVFLMRRDLVALRVLILSAGIACCIKYDGFLLVPGIIVSLRIGEREKGPLELLACLPYFAGFAIAIAWACVSPEYRMEYYTATSVTKLAWQGVRWAPTTMAAWAVASWWPISLLSVVGIGVLTRIRAVRSISLYSVSMLGLIAAAICINRDWSARHILIAIPLTITLASVGFQVLPWKRAIRFAIILALWAGSAYVSADWVAAEKEIWNETIGSGRTIAEIRRSNPEAVVWTDDTYLTPYWARSDLQPLNDPRLVKSGDYVLLHDVYGPLNRGTSLDEFREAIGAAVAVAEYSSSFRPLAGGLIDPSLLAERESLADIGPAPFWHRDESVTVRALLLRKD
ncbi:MAG: glycosyltransferase family 39 protein [Deltaproteobacteria bacterium]|nr:glycosyltransferase family 39 protein [Deltaproteobacteria bacterium]